jgi:hypothetical protein
MKGILAGHKLRQKKRKNYGGDDENLCKCD